MADPRNSCRVSSPGNYFPHAVRRAFPPQLKLKHKKCAPPRPRCVYMHDRCAYVLVERGGASIYGSLTHHLLQIQARFIEGRFTRRGGEGGDIASGMMSIGITAMSRFPAFHSNLNYCYEPIELRLAAVHLTLQMLRSIPFFLFLNKERRRRKNASFVASTGPLHRSLYNKFRFRTISFDLVSVGILSHFETRPRVSEHCFPSYSFLCSLPASHFLPSSD